MSISRVPLILHDKRIYFFLRCKCSVTELIYISLIHMTYYQTGLIFTR